FFFFLNPPPPPPRLLNLWLVAVAVALVAMAEPAWAQVNMVSLTSGQNITFSEERNGGCLLGNNSIMLTSSAIIPSGTEVRYLVSTKRGYNYFRNHGVDVFLSSAANGNLSDIRSNVITASTGTAGISVTLPGLCVADDRIDPQPAGTGTRGNTTSAIEVTLLSVAGFAIDRNMASAMANIRGDDRCHQPDAGNVNGGVVYRFRNGNMNDSCVCMSKSSVVAAGIADGELESYATTALNWRTDSTDYCPESPYQRPGG
ncbi:MAG: hypothetical protein OXE81_04075, partial [Gammaproteobacteria bacterium]|nr:hypothetical protein [Gammaproteobacteria bacterium]